MKSMKLTAEMCIPIAQDIVQRFHEEMEKYGSVVWSDYGKFIADTVSLLEESVSDERIEQ